MDESGLGKSTAEFYDSGSLMPGAILEANFADGDEDVFASASMSLAGQSRDFVSGNFDIGMPESMEFAMALKRMRPNSLMGSDGFTAVADEWPSGNVDESEFLRPTKRLRVAPQVAQVSPLEQLCSNQYLHALRQAEKKLNDIRQNFVDNKLEAMYADLTLLRETFAKYGAEFEEIKSTEFLRPADFNNLLSLDEFLRSTLMAQLALRQYPSNSTQICALHLRQYEQDYHHLTDLTAPPKPAVHLAIVSQATAGPIFKDKVVGPITLRLLTGATISQIQSGPVQPEIYDATQQRIKRNNQELENAKLIFKENGTVTFSDLKFSSGTFPNLVRLQFSVNIQVVINDIRISKRILSEPSNPYISMTNTGSQWKDAAALYFKEECFAGLHSSNPLGKTVVTTAQMWNYFQRHFLLATKQSITAIKRPLSIQDFEYLLRAKFKQGTDKPTITLDDFQMFWDWIGPALKKIRYQKYLLWLFENGYLACFVTGQEAEERLRSEPPGAFIVRLSERIDGEFAITYVHQSGVRHYLLQPDDTSEKKRTLVDFLGRTNQFEHIMQLTTQANGKRIYYKHNKNKVLQKYYKKKPKTNNKPPHPQQNPYDTQLLQ